MITLVVLAAAVDLPVRTISLSAAALARPIRIECPVEQTTRIVFPEPFVNVKTSVGAREALGLVPEASEPRGVIRIVPPSHPAKATIEARQPTIALTLILQTVPKGVGSEVRLTIAPPPSPAAGVAAHASAPPPPRPSPQRPNEAEDSASRVPGAAAPGSPSVDTAPAPSLPATVVASPAPQQIEPTPVPDEPPGTLPPSPASVEPMAPAASRPPAMDFAGLVLAKPVAIGRREGLPGQRPFLLVDALKGDQWIWFRFSLEGGASERVAAVGWEGGAVATLLQQAARKDLELTVQLPRARVSKKTHLTLTLQSGAVYRFALSAPTFTSFLKNLF